MRLHIDPSNFVGGFFDVYNYVSLYRKGFSCYYPTEQQKDGYEIIYFMENFKCIFK